jgi:hypothetical protein
LFATACKESLDAGFDGYVIFIAKTKLISHYIRTLEAQLLDPKRRKMVIKTEAAIKLVSTYF